MAVKTITVTEAAYKALKSLKASRESFSDTILRVAQKKSLREFAGLLSAELADELEQNIRKMRQERNQAHKKRMMFIAEAFGET